MTYFYNETSDKPSYVRFYADGLVTKYGFHDGMLLARFLQQYLGDPVEHAKRTLYEVVRQYVVPALDHAIELQPFTPEILYNPARAATVDGYWADDWVFPFNPGYVDVSARDILHVHAIVRNHA